MTFTVTNLNDSGIGSLRQAVLDTNNAAATDDTIVFQSGLSGLLLTSGGMIITDNLVINGPGTGLIINGNNAQRIFTVNSGVTATLSNLKLQNGGIQNSGTLTLSNSTIQSSTWAGNFGAAVGNGGIMTINSSLLTNNSASYGAIYNSGTLTINSSTVSDNPTFGIYNDNDDTLTVNSSTLSGNSGSGIYSGSRSVLTVLNSTLSGNSASIGGGIRNYGTATVRNCTLSANSASSASYGGGAIYHELGNLTVLNSTISGNTAVTTGGGIHNWGVISIGNSLVAGNSAPNGKEIHRRSGTFTSLGNNLFGVNGSSGLLDANPIASDKILPGPLNTAIGPLDTNGGPTLTFLPVAGSLMIDGGNDLLVQQGVTTDQRGYGPRIAGSAVDIGAVEAGALPPDQALINDYYQAILGRPSDAAGAAFWKSEADRARSLGLDIKDVFRVMSNLFFTSAEYLNRNTSNTQYVTDLYRTFFKREPDSGGLAYWTQPLTAGLPRSVLLFSFLFSTEFDGFMQSLFGDAAAARSELATVGDFYRGFLNRLPDNDGFAFWLGRFRVAQCTNAAAVRVEVESISSQFLASTEYTSRQRSDRDFVADLYYVFLRRGGDAAGFNYWVNQLSGGIFTRDQVRQEFVKATEFQARVNQIIGQGCL
ncbi:MAG TPA: DUF4214 domain-containing protein [Candidatus Contendobacter sp.]|nr:DUF4214 domain-containing protein [Candidatus Contendobacter sp.]HRD49355.1 DUF4214 domain-containing protein [Candidatus Contendobacter sp.]